MQKTGLGEPRAKIGYVDIAEFVAWSNGQFERSTFQMIDEDFQIVWLDEGVLRRVAEEIVGMAHDELIERRGGSHQHGARASAAAASAPSALPGDGDGAWIAGHDDGIEGADINAELKRARRNNSTDFSIAEATFDFAALIRQVAAAVSANGFRFSRQPGIRLLQIGKENLRVQARVREDHGLQIVFQEFLRHARSFVDIAAADAERAIHDGRIVENESFLCGGRAVGIEDFDFGFEKAGSEVAGIGNGCRATDELRIAAVEASDAAKAAQHVAQVAAEDAAVGVQFVDHDVTEVFEEARPASMVRQDPSV